MDSQDAAGFNNLVDTLRYAADHQLGKIILYPPDNIRNPLAAQEISYDELLATAEANAGRLRQMMGGQEAFQLGVVILHFENAIDSIIWYWSVVLAGGIPCMSSPGMLNNNLVERRNHLNHICKMLKQPLCLTRKSLLPSFDGQDENSTIVSVAIEDVQARSAPVARPRLDKKSPSDIAALMFTSGTSGNSKAVPLTHRQILAAFRGKAESAALRYQDSPFLSWVGMDHVANLVHCHLFAIASGVSQVQIPATAVLEDPIELLNLWSRHRVSRTFAPNFLFAKLLRQLKSGETLNLDPDLNLEALFLDTGGEANVIEVCRELQALLSQYGAPDDVFKPSFGMTETCAGCIFNLRCPSYDTSEQHDFASLGRPMPGLQIRVRCLESSTANAFSSSFEAETGETGYLELKGEVIFQGYFNNDKATAQSFTSDGWFRTGDLGYLDAGGNLHLVGRVDDVINVNGVKYLPHELDAALEQARISGAAPTYYCCFSRKRDRTMDTGGITVLYLPDFDPGNDEARFETQSSIARVIGMRTRCWPYVLPLRAEDLPKSTLGKLSRSKLKVAFESGKFEAQRTLNDEAIKNHREKTRGEPETPQEATILSLVRKQLALADLSVNDSLLSAGATSMDLIALKSKINQALQLPKVVELLDLLNYPTVRGIAARAAMMVDGHSEYDPVITLQPHGSKPPLWLVHPGVGEVLVFINLARHITDRPVYAFRAKGFEKADAPFSSLSELFETYRRAMKKRQPAGPYAIAGYSFGGIVAFEVTKLLEAGGDEVRYCGSWNLPPHIKTRMRELVWDECIMHLFYFVELMEETEIYKHKEALCAFERQGKRLEAIQYLRPLCDQARWEELGLTEEYYLNWVSIAYNMQGLAVNYEPEGTIKCMDVFVADPLTHIARDRKSWIANRLAAWSDFVREDVYFHEVDGAHYTMLNAKYVDISRFAQTLRKVLAARLV